MANARVRYTNSGGMGAKPKAKSAPKSQATPDANAPLKPEVALGSRLRSQALKKEKAKKAAYKGPLVDINTASREELKKLPSVTDESADKIIAGRPYKTKAHLLTHNVVSYGLYETLKHRVIAKQPGVK